MELLRRALLVGCALSGLWLLRLAPLDPILSIRRVDFAERQRQEASSVPDDRKTDAERRRGLIPLSVYIEETLQYNVFSAVGAEWDRFLATIDASRTPSGEAAAAFVQPDAAPVRAVAGKLAAGGGTTYISMSRPGGDVHYEVVEHQWTREDFRPGQGFAGAPVPPASLLYPFRMLGFLLIAAGGLLFVLLPTPPATARVAAVEAASFVMGLLFFAAPLAAVGGSAQALTRGTWLTIPCWMLAAAGMHVFAAPWRTAPHPAGASGDGLAAGGPPSALFLREGLVFLLVAAGPVAFLVWGTMVLWNR